MDKPKNHSCSSCGRCCRLFLINLTQEEWLSGKYKTQFKKFDLNDDFSIIQNYGGNLLSQKKDGSCIYLKNNLCSIHEKRPQSCKEFFCESTLKKFKGMIKMINNKKED
jgi:Fe-S-cluster containining protein